MDDAPTRASIPPSTATTRPGACRAGNPAMLTMPGASL
jgi:hypothetical protein